MISSASPRFRAIVASTALILALATAGCGSGSGEAGSTSGSDRPVAPELLENQILDVKYSGLTTSGNFESKQAYLSYSPYVLESAGPEAASARFAFPVPYRGYYRVYLWWPQVEPAGSVEATARHSAGVSSQRVESRLMGGQWTLLGSLPFDPSEGGAIDLHKVGSGPLIVDALRIQYVGEQPPPLAAGTASLPLAERGRPYSSDIALDGGFGPRQFTVVEGRLPEGIQLDRHTGELSGTPSAIGVFPFSVQVTDSALHSWTGPLELVVLAPPASAPEPQPEPEPEPPEPQPQPEPPSNPPSPAEYGLLGEVVASLPEGEWAKVNVNAFSSVWSPPELRPLIAGGNPPPSKIIQAWSSFGWDSNRNSMILYGGGHANYRGNDVYIWRGVTGKWERASLPSEMVQDPLGNWNAIDGADNAPASAHTYDNTIFLPIVDRLLVLGGAADSNGGHYLRQASATTSRPTGPYLFDPNRVDGTRVGGTTGSHVKRVGAHPEIIGGRMWSNRDNFINVSSPPLNGFVNACTAYLAENGKDNVLLHVVGTGLFKYTLHAFSDPTRDTWTKVGLYWGGDGGQGSCGYDPERRVLVRLGTKRNPFVYWNLETAGPENKDVNVMPVDPTGAFEAALASGALQIPDCGLDFDPTRRTFAMWCSGATVWMLEPPSPLGRNGWVIRKQPSPIGSTPTKEVLAGGVLGKWEYAPGLDVFVALQDPVEGNVWVYKPVGWKGFVARR